MPYTYMIALTVNERLAQATRDGLCDIITEVVEGEDLEIADVVTFVSGPTPANVD